MKNEKSIMERIAESAKSVTTGIEAKDIKHWVTIYIMGRGYRVPADLTILTAMEYAGYKFIRVVGCRQGFCGACYAAARKGLLGGLAGVRASFRRQYRQIHHLCFVPDCYPDGHYHNYLCSNRSYRSTSLSVLRFS